MNNAERRQLQQQFIILDASFMASPYLDKSWSAKATVTNPGTVPGCSGLHGECLFPVYLTEKSGHTGRT